MKRKKTEIEPKVIKATINTTPAWLASFVSGWKWQFADHLKLLNQVLIDAVHRENKRIIINMPPRHGKSELISKYFPAWYLGNFPTHKIILTSYEAGFAESWGRKVRDILVEHGEALFGISLNPSSRSVAEFEILGSGGGMSCAGAGGPITGKGADVLIIDDPVKNDAEANSPVIRDNVWNWFKATAYTRLEPDGIIIIIMTRWHEDDLCGRIIKQIHDNIEEESGEDWFIVKLPAIAEEGDILGRLPGTALWHQRFPIGRLNNIRRTQGSYLFSALYQQNPSSMNGGIFKRKYFKYFSEKSGLYNLNGNVNYSKERCSVFATMDLAVSTSERSDYTVIIIFAVTPLKEILIIDIIRERFEGADHLNLIKSVFSSRKPLMIGIESVQYQKSLIQSALREGLPVKSLKADKDKVSRSLVMSARLEEGIIYFRDNAPWLGAFEDELILFPNGKHDDQVDAFSYISQMIQPMSYSMPAGKRNKAMIEEN